MTDPSSLTTTNPIVNPVPVTAVPTLQSPLLNGTTSDTNAPEEEEYTIKCICGYADDDGNTVYCEKCDTWQHIECYYPAPKKVPDEHFCSDCLPRDVDAKRAAERQRRHREALDGGDRKVKRPSSKNAKKKHKDSPATAEQVNGWHLPDRHESLTNGRDQPPPAKKPKTSHRASGSVASLNGDTRKRASSNVQSYPSPSKSPQDAIRSPPIPWYTAEFLELYQNDHGSTNAQNNEHTIPALNQLSAWRSDPSLIAGAGAQPSSQAPFVRATEPLDETLYPQTTVESIERKEMEVDGKIPQWKYIKTQTSIPKDTIIGEVRGEVGMLDEYCQQHSSPNRWHELAHPDPFVFFHPHMNIYIDSRKTGTHFRYLRRSCSPNVTLKTFVSDDGDWRHCVVARDDILPGKELTTVWYLDAIMFTHFDQDDQKISRRYDWVSRVLANFGDCACGRGAACSFASLDRRYPLKPTDAIEKGKNKAKRKTKTKTAISPKSTGQATNSRAGSEALKQEDDQSDQRSTSGSASDAKSRDMTPVNVAALDADPVLGSQLTAREIRKLKAMEEREQGKDTQQKKTKKRASAGSTLNTPTPNTRGLLNSPYLSTSSAVGAEQYSGSPPPRFSAAQQRSLGKSIQARPVTPRPVYKEVSTQTEPDDVDIELPPPKRMKYVTPTQRLLRKVLANRTRYEQQCKAAGVSPRSASASPTTSPSRDVDMRDVGSAVSPMSAKSVPLPSPSSSETSSASPTVSPTYPLPSQAAHSHQHFKIPAPPKLQITSMPPVPVFSPNGQGSPTTVATTPGLSASSTVQSPLALHANPNLGLHASVITPSPAKKKLSLGDYMKARRNTSSGTTPGAEKTQSQTQATQGDRKSSDGSPAPPESGIAAAESIKKEAAILGGLHENAIDDTPMKDADEEPEYIPPEPSVGESAVESSITELPMADVPVPSATPKPFDINHVSPEVNNVMARLAQLQEKTRSQ